MLADGPYSQMDKRQLRARIWSDLRSSSHSSSYSSSYPSSYPISANFSLPPTAATTYPTSNFSLRIKLEAEQNLRYPADRAWAKHLDKS